MPTPIDILGGFYTDESLPWSCQDVVNYIPVAAEVPGTRTQIKLVDAPGLKPRAWIGNYATDPEPTGAIRGMHDVEGKLFVVCGTTLYQFTNTGVAVALGTVPGTGRVSMAHNQITGGNQLIVVNGSSGYVWNTVDRTFQRVVDSSYPGASIVEFVDGYLMQLEPFGRFLLHSDLANALSYNALDRFEAETAPDMTVGLAILHQEVWALGERTIDVFENVGATQGTFRNKGVSISRGCVARWSTAVIDNGLAWLGDNGTVYHARGYDPVRISTRAIEVALSSQPLANLRNAFAFVWEDRGHAVYYLTVPGGPTFGYDFSTGLWHRRASWHPQRELSGRWRLNELIRHNGKWVGGDYKAGKLYDLDWTYMMEGEDSPLVRERVTPVAHNNADRFIVNEVELLYDSGGPETEPVSFPTQPRGPSIEGSAPDGQVGTAYEGFTYTIAEGDAPIASVVIVSGSVPSGLTFSDGVIDTAEPTTQGNYTFTIVVTDENGLTAVHTDSIHISQYYRVFGAYTSGNVLRWTDFDHPWDPTRYITSPVNFELIQIGGRKLYAVGNGELAVYDLDEEEWETGTTDAPSSPPAKSLVQAGDSKWLYCTGSNPSVLYASTNGKDFAGFSPGVGGQIYSLARRGTVIIGAATGNWIKSTDEGATWTSIGAPFSNARVIRATPNGFFAIGGGGQYGRCDANGENWKTRTIPGSPTTTAMDVGDGIVMVVAGNDIFVGDPDADEPLAYASTLPAGLTSSLNDNRLVFAGGKWFTGGNGDLGLVSEDNGQSWNVVDISSGSGGMRTFAVDISG